MIAKDSFKSLILSAVSLDDAVVDPWMKATRYGRVNFAEVCCTSDSLLSGAVTSLGGRVVQYSHWNGFDLTTKAGTDKWKEDLPEKKPRVVWMTPPCTTQRSQQSQSKSRFHRVQMNILIVFLWLVKQDWCEAILEQMGVALLMECFLQNPGSSSAHIDVGQTCCVLDDVIMITLIKRWRRKRCDTHRSWSRQWQKIS